MTLGFALLIIFLGAVLVGCIRSAPDRLIPADWKGFMSWAVLVIVLIVLVSAIFGGFSQLTNIRIGK